MSVLPSLVELEAEGRRRELLLRLQVNRPAGLGWTLRVGVARRQTSGTLQLLGELKGWALPTAAGLRLDTMRVQGDNTAGVGALIWAATFAWALEATPCRRATILAIRDNDRQHQRLVRYFQRLGFAAVGELGAGVLDLGPRLLWGGSGLLMQIDCCDGLARSSRMLGLGAGEEQPQGPSSSPA
ncbi:MAG: hypothetical protein VKM98_00520 [Cyanobacteriota bacterium]|nr:hypothetical protein [Cyanobacteriota bacterium]